MNIVMQPNAAVLLLILSICPISATGDPAIFGSGTYSGTANYAFGDSGAPLRVLMGSRAQPAATCDASFIVEKASACETTRSVNASIYGAIHKMPQGRLTRATAIYGEAQDHTGGEDSFIEGGRFQGTVVAENLGSGYGVIGVAGTAPGVGFKYIIGIESDVENNSRIPAPAPAAFNKDHYSAAYVATSGMTRDARVADVAYIVNPYSMAGFQTGFMVARNSVVATGAAFVSDADTTVGLDLSRGRQSRAAILMPNASSIRVKSADQARDLNAFQVDAQNVLVLGMDTTHVAVAGDIVVSGGVRQRSDSAQKTRVAPIANSLDRISRLQGVSFEWRDAGHGTGPQIGLLAENVEGSFPELVGTDAKGVKTVSYTQLIAPVIEAVKALHRENSELRARVEAQQADLGGLLARIRALEQGGIHAERRQ